MLVFFSTKYNYVRIWKGFANLYEAGNATVAVDTLLQGKLPVIDYFSAHALKDVFTRIIYGFLHSDADVVFSNPYSGIVTIFSFLFLFYIIKKIFDTETAALYVLLFPGILNGIKWSTECFLAIALLLWLQKKSGKKEYLCFWATILFTAFFVYDEGISLGIACIAAQGFVLAVNKEWIKLKQFIFSGLTVGAAAVLFYVIYALITGIPVISRIIEWLSVSVGSNSTWATERFGKASTFPVLISYTVVPILVVAILLTTVWLYYKTRAHTEIALLVIVFAIAQILYIPRTIVYHNMSLDQGSTGVLLNFTHWTVSLFVLYCLSVKGKSRNRKLFAWMTTMFAVILLEGVIVTGFLPDGDSAIMAKGLRITSDWDLQNNVTENLNRERITLDEETTELVNSFKNIFDVLLAEDETFMDFANITSMYALTGRTRPSYVGQTPSLLTNLYSQECYLEQIEAYDCPLAVLGTTETNYLQQMVGIPHNIRYYKIAEYIYQKYRPLVQFGEFVIWAEKTEYENYCRILNEKGFEEKGYAITDYGYDATQAVTDANGQLQYEYKPYHSYDLRMLPYIWANYDEMKAFGNQELQKIAESTEGSYRFDGSQGLLTENGNYMIFEYTNNTGADTSVTCTFCDSKNEGARFQYTFTAVPGTALYMIRVSSDYFWSIYNINEICFAEIPDTFVKNVRILAGD